jgi:branched-chain amino acid transport system permease protein
VAFGIGIAFAGAAGGLLAMMYSFTPDFGGSFLLRAFVIIVLGGLESFAGVAVGALILALVETFSILVIPSGYQPAISFSLLVLALVILPDGLAGLWKKRQRLA